MDVRIVAAGMMVANHLTRQFPFIEPQAAIAPGQPDSRPSGGGAALAPAAIEQAISPGPLPRFLYTDFRNLLQSRTPVVQPFGRTPKGIAGVH